MFVFCIASEVFSVMCGASSTAISLSWLRPPGFFGASLMSTTFFGAFGALTLAATAFSVLSAVLSSVFGRFLRRSLQALLDEFHGAGGHQHLVIAGQRQRVELRHRQDFDVHEIARGEEQLLVDGLDHDEYVLELE